MIKSKLVLLLLLGAMAAPGLVFAQPVTKVDSLRWAMMMWEKTGDAEMAALIDSLRLCITAEKDDGSGVTVEVGDSEGLSVTPLYETQGMFVPGRGYTHVWKGRNEGSPETIDILQVDVLETQDPQDGEGPGIGMGIDFPALNYETLRIVITNGEEVVVDTLIADPGPGIPPPGPFPLPELPVVVWIDWGGSDFPDFTWCEKTDLEKAAETDFLNLGPNVRRAAETPVLGFSYQLIKPRDFWIMGADKPAFGDRIAIVPQGQTLVPDYITGMTIMPRQLSEVSIIDASVYKYGLAHFPNLQSDADLSFRRDTMLIGGISSSGLDGIRTTFPQGTHGVTTTMRPLSLRDGETLSWALTGQITLGTELVNDSLIVLWLNGIGNKTFLMVDMHPSTGWDEFTMQFVKDGVVRRERKVSNGSSFGIRDLVITGLAKANLTDQGWEGFKVDILRNGSPAEIRIVPPVTGQVWVEETSLTASSPFGDMEVAYEEIQWTVVAAAAPHARAETDARLTSPVVRVAEVPQLQGNYPEPFNPVTTIRYALPEAAHVRLEVFDLTGRRVALLADGERPAGQYAARFDASRLASGMYLYRLRAGATVQTRTMMLLK